MKLVWVIFLSAASVATINCSSTKIRVAKKQENTNWNSEVQCVDDAGLQENENDLQKRVIAATVTITATVVGAVAAVVGVALSEIGNHSPKIAIGISNETPYKWKDVDIEFYTGTSNDLAPVDVSPKETLIYKAYMERLNSYGPAGVIAFNIPRDEVTLCVLFSVPYDRISSHNWWNVKSFLGKINANEDPCTFENLYNKLNPLKGDDNRITTPMDFYYSAEGGMSSGNDCKLELHIKKKVAPGTAVSAATVRKAIPTVLAEIGDQYSQKISIGIINETPYEWERLNVYFSDGTSDATLPDHVPTGKGFNYSARKKKFAAYGAAGVIAFHIPDDNISLCFLYSVPFGALRFNWWNVKSFLGKVKANEDPCTFTKLYSYNPVEGDNDRQTTAMDFYYSAEGNMSSVSECTLELRIKKKVAPGTAVSAGTVIKAIPTVLTEIGDQYSGKISIGIINETPYEWERLNVYLFGGTSDITLPDHVPTGKGFNYSAKDDAAGVIALYIKKDNKTLHIFFSVPGSNLKWNLAIHSGKKCADKTWYHNLNKANPREGDGKIKKDYCMAEGNVKCSSSGCTLELYIKKKAVH
ncbi:uncharacterized protein [Montipora capricornis]|uniref:uncharacterized protein n=1 Tax=Montipora capricornis TaxID=246305 RepID=UPI0035F21119